MKKIFVVSKTHLDLGFTDYAENIRRKYIESYIPQAISLTKQLNTADKKQFIWTTGSWILKEALQDDNETRRKNLENAIRLGDIVPHAMPFTTHTELLDEETLNYGLSIVDSIDSLRGRKTVAAKMTDVPGHTRALVPLLAKKGIKLLHIGVNGASALADIPECFLWKDGKYEIIVIYSGTYGGAFKCDYIDEILYFDHTLDNHGAPSASKIKNKLAKIQSAYPDYEITAGNLDEYADILWEQRSKLPVFSGEIGDTWIHGSASDPYKTAALRRLMNLKLKWLSDGSMQKNSSEYNSFSDNLLCVAEHTWGMDIKHYFADYEHYLKKDFQKARKSDKVVMHHPFRDFPQNFSILCTRISGIYTNGSYSVIEKSWKEQRAYIEKAVDSLSEEHKKQAVKELSCLQPKAPEPCSGSKRNFFTEYNNWTLEINENGGIGRLSYGSTDIIRKNNEPVFEYRSYALSDYNYWLTHYTRDLDKTRLWAVGDFARPLLKYADGHYLTGRFPYTMTALQTETRSDNTCVTVNLVCDKKLSETLGAPRLVQIIYTLSENGLNVRLSWFNKDANRLTEALFFRLFPAGGKLIFNKIGRKVEPTETVSMGSRNLSAVFSATFQTDNGNYDFINIDSPLISVGKGKILEFDNKFESMEKDGLTYVLYNNVWGTNFPLWYEENASFEFMIKQNPGKSISD